MCRRPALDGGNGRHKHIRHLREYPAADARGCRSRASLAPICSPGRRERPVEAAGNFHPERVSRPRVDVGAIPAPLRLADGRCAVSGGKLSSARERLSAVCRRSFISCVAANLTASSRSRSTRRVLPLALVRTPAEDPGFSTYAAEFARETDSLLEEGRFESSVPRNIETLVACFFSPHRIFPFRRRATPSREGPRVRISLPPSGESISAVHPAFNSRFP
jgi:hypothetical protein